MTNSELIEGMIEAAIVAGMYLSDYDQACDEAYAWGWQQAADASMERFHAAMEHVEGCMDYMEARLEGVL